MMVTTVISVVTPIISPRTVSAVRSLCALRASKLSASVSLGRSTPTLLDGDTFPAFPSSKNPLTGRDLFRWILSCYQILRAGRGHTDRSGFDQAISLGS